jgi:hypothetical protein
VPISSRTPEGDPNCCPICGKDVRIEPSAAPTSDAPCPHCGSLLWFTADSSDASDTVCESLLLVPGRRRRVITFLAEGRKRFGSIPNGLIRPLIEAEGMLLTSRKVRNREDVESIIQAVDSWPELVYRLQHIAGLPSFSRIYAARMFVRRQLRKLVPR